MNPVALCDTFDSQNFLSPTSKRRLEIDLKNAYQPEFVDEESLPLDDESKDDEELKECRGELLRKSGTKRDKSFLDMGSDEVIVIPMPQDDDEFKPKKQESYSY